MTLADLPKGARFRFPGESRERELVGPPDYGSGLMVRMRHSLDEPVRYPASSLVIQTAEPDSPQRFIVAAHDGFLSGPPVPAPPRALGWGWNFGPSSTACCLFPRVAMHLVAHTNLALVTHMAEGAYHGTEASGEPWIGAHYDDDGWLWRHWPNAPTTGHWYREDGRRITKATLDFPIAIPTPCGPGPEWHARVVVRPAP